MNKKTLFLAAGVMMATASFAQKDKLKEATKELDRAVSHRDKPDEAAEEYQKAKAAIDLAASNPETSGNAKTWMTKAGIYIGMQENAKLNADNPYREGITALKKAFELDKKLVNEQDAITLTANAAYYAYNDGINIYNDSKFGKAYETFKVSSDLLGPDKDKRFILIPDVDTVRAKARMFMGYTAFYDKKPEAAIPLLEEAKTSPYLAASADIYIELSRAYEAAGNKDKQLAVIKEGRQKFPDDKNLSALEVNYALASGNENEAIAKIEESIAKDPGNPDLYLNLGILYSTLARPMSGNPPANAKEYSDKAEAAYKKTVELSPDNGTYQYQLGAFYFNQAADLNTKMNALGTSKEDQRKYNEMLKQRDDLFAQSLPSLEKSKDIFKPRKAKLRGEEAKFYVDALTALKEIYNRTDQAAKVAEIRKLIEEMNQ